MPQNQAGIEGSLRNEGRASFDAVLDGGQEPAAFLPIPSVFLAALVAATVATVASAQVASNEEDFTARRVVTFTTLDGPTKSAATPPAVEDGGVDSVLGTRLRVFWASPPLATVGPTFGAGEPVDVAIGARTLEGLRPGQITDYLELDQNITSRSSLDVVVGEKRGGRRIEHASYRLAVDRGFHTLVIEGYRGSFQFHLFSDSSGAPEDSLLRVVHLYPHAPPLEVGITDQSTAQALYRDLLAASGDDTDYLKATASVSLEVQAADSRALLAATRLSGLQPGRAMTIWLVEPGATEGEPEETLLLGNGRFAVTVQWAADERSGRGRGHQLTADTGTFWFFHPDNQELMVKVLDGRDLNGHFWVFYGSLTNVEFQLTVVDRETGRSASYLNPAGRFESRGDTEALLP